MSILSYKKSLCIVILVCAWSILLKGQTPEYTSVMVVIDTDLPQDTTEGGPRCTHVVLGRDKEGVYKEFININYSSKYLINHQPFWTKFMSYGIEIKEAIDPILISIMLQGNTPINWVEFNPDTLKLYSSKTSWVYYDDFYKRIPKYFFIETGDAEFSDLAGYTHDYLIAVLKEKGKYYWVPNSDKMPTEHRWGDRIIPHFLNSDKKSHFLETNSAVWKRKVLNWEIRHLEKLVHAYREFIIGDRCILVDKDPKKHLYTYSSTISEADNDDGPNKLLFYPPVGIINTSFKDPLVTSKNVPFQKHLKYPPAFFDPLPTSDIISINGMPFPEAMKKYPYWQWASHFMNSPYWGVPTPTNDHQEAKPVDPKAPKK